METSTCWSELHFDLLASIFEQLSFLDFQRAKIVCSNWYSASKHSVIKKKGSPWLILFPKDNNCVLYNPELNQIYLPRIAYFGFRFLANSGKWFLVITPELNLCIIDLFTSEKIDLPPLESLVLCDNHILQRMGHKEINFVRSEKEYSHLFTCIVDSIRGLLWVDEKNKANYVVVWYLHSSNCCGPCSIAFCKNGYDKYVNIPIQEEEEKQELNEVLHNSRHMVDMVLKGYKLYAYFAHSCVRVWDFSGQSFQDFTQMKTSPLGGGLCCRLTVTLSGEVLLLTGVLDYHCLRGFKVYNDVSEVASFGSDGEALLIDLGVTTSVKDAPGIEPNLVYFSRHSLYHTPKYKVDVCVLNLATKTIKRFLDLSDIYLEDALWFIPTLG